LITIPTDAAEPNNPRIGWHNLVTFSNISASASDPAFPVTNLADGNTYAKWKGMSAGAHSIVVDLGAPVEVSYVGLARHNLGDSGASYTVESSSDDVSYSTIAGPVEPGDNAVIVHEFAPVTQRFVRVTISAGSLVPSLAVLYVGRILTLERRLYVGHCPLPYGRNAEVSSGRSESGEFLGRITRRTFYETTFSLQNLTPEHWRDDVAAFQAAAVDTPFFVAWRPGDYPAEIGYVWSKDDMKPQNQRSNGMMQFDFGVQGLLA